MLSPSVPGMRSNRACRYAPNRQTCIGVAARKHAETVTEVHACPSRAATLSISLPGCMHACMRGGLHSAARKKRGKGHTHIFGASLGRDYVLIRASTSSTLEKQTRAQKLSRALLTSPNLNRNRTGHSSATRIRPIPHGEQREARALKSSQLPPSKQRREGGARRWSPLEGAEKLRVLRRVE